MTLKVAIQMDPLESIDVEADSTFLLGLEAQARGYQLYHYLPENLTPRHCKLIRWTSAYQLYSQVLLMICTASGQYSGHLDQILNLA